MNLSNTDEVSREVSTDPMGVEDLSNTDEVSRKVSTEAGGC